MQLPSIQNKQKKKMKKKDWIIVASLLTYCELNQLDYKAEVARLIEGETEFDGIQLSIVPKKLTKAEKLEADMKLAAEIGVGEIHAGGLDKLPPLKQIQKQICIKNPELFAEAPNLFKRAIANALAEFDKSHNLTRSEKTLALKESEINPAMKEWFEKQGGEVIPLPEQDPALKRF